MEKKLKNLKTFEQHSKNLNISDVRQRFNQGDKIKIIHDDGKVEYGEFHRYGASRNGAIVFINDVMRFVDEESINVA